MTNPVGGLGSQPRTEFSEYPLDRVTSNDSHKTRETSDEMHTSESTSLSSGAANVKTLAAAAANQGVFRSDRVAQLRQAIGGGDYQVNPQTVADALIQEWRRPTMAAGDTKSGNL